MALCVCTFGLDKTAHAADPAIPALSEPNQTQATSVYVARRAALMKAMGEGVAVVYAQGEEDYAGYRQSGDFFYLTGVEEKGRSPGLGAEGENLQGIFVFAQPRHRGRALDE